MKATAEMLNALRARAASRDDEAPLYAVAIGLHDPHDRRFQV
jgi:hypothetical protein